eukprot:TRINITY_DN18725_c0_g1_i1.p1 TRINITY_DN18725_c0_g1~~TRINITY_DN18725_c0_g1_i1.p1  ORF type:complete len:564 (-),score=126.21 TRINITY_DN18725_c0_g1_i1:165-1856(-)
MRTPKLHHFEQSSEDIWQACCSAVQGALQAARATASDLKVCALAFDATCSLVVVGEDDEALGVGAASLECSNPSGGYVDSAASEALIYDVIVWCDTRATEEASIINRTGHRLLQNVGGGVSPEMEMPKLLWLKKHKPKTYAAARRFFDLPDYLADRAAGGCAILKEAAGARSMCTVVCKWNFDAENHQWDPEFLEAVDLADLGEHRIGRPSDIRDVGAAVPGGVAEKPARELGVPAGTPLAVGIIDAHAGGIGCLGGNVAEADVQPELSERLALIAGTSCCHMASSPKPVFVPGVWGPYASAMVPGFSLTEGGQSAAGSALDYVIETHSAYPLLCAAAETRSLTPHVFLEEHLKDMALSSKLRHYTLLTTGLFVGPDFSGNRSPLADPAMRGSVLGLGPAGDPEKAKTIDALAVLYLATLQALAYSTKAIVEAINVARQHAGVKPIAALFASGGLAKNSLYLQAHADALSMPVYLPQESEAMLLGSAMLAATAAGRFHCVPDAMAAMGRVASAVSPCKDPVVVKIHETRYEVFRRMQKHQQEYRALEAEALRAISSADCVAKV